jgi:SAM-dependent methyltransferase
MDNDPEKRSEFERWDGLYQEGKLPWNTEKPSSELVRAVESGEVPRGSALELGCGVGTNALYLAEQGFDVVAVDLSPTAISTAKDRAERSRLRVDFRVASLTDDPNLGGPYDFLFDRQVYHVIRKIDLDAYLRLLQSVSRPGTLYLSLSGNAREEREIGPPQVSEPEIRTELGGLFEIARLTEFYFDESVQIKGRFLGWSALLRRR